MNQLFLLPVSEIVPTTKDIKTNFFSIEKFLVQIVYDAQHNVITEVRSFKYGHSLDKYATKIDKRV